MIRIRNAVLLVLIGALLGGGVAYRSLRPHAASEAEVTPRKILYWYDPMVPDRHFDKPGKSPFMDMELVPKYAGDNAHAGVQVAAATQQNLALRTAAVERTALSATVTVPGTIAFDQRDLTVLQARANGFVQRVHVNAPGDRVRRGDVLAELLIPDWAGVQQELTALKKTGDTQLLEAARRRALALGMSAQQVAEIEKTEKASPVFSVRAPRDGVVQALEIREGMNVSAGATLLALNGVERVWFEMAVPETIAAAIAPGQPIIVDINGRSVSAKILALLPELNNATRSIRVRAAIDNRDGELRIGQYAQAKIAGAASTVLSIPAQAVIRGGAGNRVIAVRGDGSFMPQAIATGREFGDRIEVLSGLSEGQRVVSSGQFLIDSEASLSGELQRLQPAPADDEAAPGHGAHRHD